VITIVRDIVRAGLVLVVLAVGLELLQAHREAAADPRPWQPAPMAAAAPPAWQPAAPIYAQPAPERPLRRVAGSFVDLADSVLGVIR
jgi:hypothetical protein